MRFRIASRRKLAMHAAVTVLVLAFLRTSVAQSIVVGGLVAFAEVTERIVRFPCWLIDHSRCFSLYRFDPTCPQCL